MFGCHYGMIYEHDAASRNQALIFYKVPNDLISSAERFSSLRFGYDANLAYFPKQKKNGKKKQRSVRNNMAVKLLKIRFHRRLCFGVTVTYPLPSCIVFQ